MVTVSKSANGFLVRIMFATMVVSSCLTLLLGSGSALARLVVDSDEADDGVEPSVSSRCGVVFAMVAESWFEEDHALLAEVVSDDGVHIALNPASRRDNTYSPSQSFYFFRNLFQSRDTDTFRYLKVPETADTARVNAVARWRYHRAGSETVEEVKLLIGLVHDAGAWELTEIRALR